MKFIAFFSVFACLAVKLVLGQSCVWEKMNIMGHDVWSRAGIDSESALKCQQSCKSMGICHFWSYNSSSKKCFGKNWSARKARMSDDAYDSGHWGCEPSTSAPTASATTQNTNVCEADKQTAPTYQTTKTGRARSAEECQRECKDATPCKHWIFFNVDPEMLCFLLEGTTNAESDTFYSGKKDCPP